jgi:hypothetical protein
VKLEDAYLKELLTRLDGDAPSAVMIEPSDEPLPVNAAATPEPPDPRRAQAEAELEQRLVALRAQLSTINADQPPPPPLASRPGNSPAPSPTPVRNANDGFVPAALNQLVEAGVQQEQIEAIALKFLLNRGASPGRQLAEQLGLPFSLMEKVLFELKAAQLVAQKGAAALSDYVYQLTPQGTEDARRAYQHCTYFGTLPVPLDDYIASVHAQSIRRLQPTADQLDCVFEDLLVNEQLRDQIGQAIHAGKGFFLHGAPGNGKTSIAERVVRAYGQYIWIPRAIGIAGDIVRLFDPCNHEAVPLSETEAAAAGPIDRRWVRIRRPTVIAGGELTMDRLEITVNRASGINEAPLQLKSNLGVLVIDDFGRQRMGVAELLNRWIVPLDRRYDFLNLPSGKTIQVPFDQLLVFSTNLEPRDLVDEAFMRRISYKIEVPDPSLDDFRKLLAAYAKRVKMAFDNRAVEHLIREHYEQRQRPVRACHARDLLDHVRSYCGYRKRPAAMSAEAFDAAVRNYFGLMDGGK